MKKFSDVEIGLYHFNGVHAIYEIKNGMRYDYYRSHDYIIFVVEIQKQQSDTIKVKFMRNKQMYCADFINKYHFYSKMTLII